MGHEKRPRITQLSGLGSWREVRNIGENTFGTWNGEDG